MKNDKKVWWAVSLVAVCGALITSGCANAGKTAKSGEDLSPAALVTTHGVGLPDITVTNTVTASNSVSVVHIKYDWAAYSGTNGDFKPLLALDFSGVAGKSVSLGNYNWKDFSKGTIHAFFADPHAASVTSAVQNQATLGGSHTFATGDYSSVVDTNTAAIVGAAGTAAGNVIGAAANAAAK